MTAPMTLLCEQIDENHHLLHQDRTRQFEATIELFSAVTARGEAEIEAATSGKSRTLAAYKKNFIQEFKDLSSPLDSLVGLEDFKQELAGAGLLFLGCYHGLRESTSLVLDLLNALLSAGKLPVLVSELLPLSAQAQLDDYLASGTGLEELLDLALESHPYRPRDLVETLLLHARQHKLHILAADNESTGLKTYVDRYIAVTEKAVALAGKQPVLVSIGQLHLATANAYGNLLKHFKAKGPILRLLQHLPQHFWALHEAKQRYNFNILRLAPDTVAFSYLPPPYVQNAYLKGGEASVKVIDSFRIHEQFLDILAHLKKQFCIDCILHEDKVKVYSYRDFNLLDDLERLKFTAEELEFVTSQIANRESFYFKKRNNNIIFLADLRLFHVAEEATHYIKQNFIKGRTQRSAADQFYYMILHEMIAFFGSKLLCPEREAVSFDYFFSLAEGEIDEEDVRPGEQEAAEFILNYFKTGTINPIEDDVAEAFSPEAYRCITHGIGYMIGNYLYNSYRKEVIDQDFIKDLMINEFKKEKCYRIFAEVLKNVEQIEKLD